MSKAEILIIDDEPQIRRLLDIILQSNGYRTRAALTAKEGIRMAAHHPPDLILLDIGLPDQRGHDVLKELRTWFTKGIIMLTVQDQEEDIVRALDLGANDYVTKPFRTSELLARIRAVLRYHPEHPGSSVVQKERLEIDLANRTVKRDQEWIHLTPTEFNLLSLLVKNEGKVLTHHFLLKEIWGLSFQQETQYLRVFVAQLRKKIEEDPNQPEHILTESGVGYRFI